MKMTACLSLARAQVTHGEPGHAKRSPLDRRGPGIYVYRELKGSLETMRSFSIFLAPFSPSLAFSVLYPALLQGP